MLNVVSCNTLFKGFYHEKRVEEALKLLHMMADDGDGSCTLDVVSYSTVINGLFGEGQVEITTCSLTGDFVRCL